jgi:hypothetical protein
LKTNLRHYESLYNANISLQDVSKGIDAKVSGDLLAMDIRRPFITPVRSPAKSHLMTSSAIFFQSIVSESNLYKISNENSIKALAHMKKYPYIKRVLNGLFN